MNDLPNYFLVGKWSAISEYSCEKRNTIRPHRLAVENADSGKVAFNA